MILVSSVSAPVAAVSAAASATVSTAATTSSALFTRACFFYYDLSAIKFSSIEGINCGLCLLVFGHFHKTKTTGASRFTVKNNLRRVYFAKLFEELLQILTLSVKMKFCYKNVHMKKRN